MVQEGSQLLAPEQTKTNFTTRCQTTQTPKMTTTFVDISPSHFPISMPLAQDQSSRKRSWTTAVSGHACMPGFPFVVGVLLLLLLLLLWLNKFTL
jgi:hypothetical protein